MTEHRFNLRGVCKNCGCSRGFVRFFNNKCRGVGLQSVKTIAVKPSDSDKESSTNGYEFIKQLSDMAIDGFGRFDSAEQIAQKFTNDEDYVNNDERVRALIRHCAVYNFTSGFVTGLGGLITLPVAVPASLLASYVIQVRMVAAIARIYGHQIDDETTRSWVCIAALGDKAVGFLKSAGVNLGKRVAAQLIDKIPARALREINKKIGIQLLSKGGSRTMVSLTKAVPVVGGIICGSIDASVCYAVGKVATRIFRPQPTEEQDVYEVKIEDVVEDVHTEKDTSQSQEDSRKQRSSMFTLNLFSWFMRKSTTSLHRHEEVVKRENIYPQIEYINFDNLDPDEDLRAAFDEGNFDDDGFQALLETTGFDGLIELAQEKARLNEWDDKAMLINQRIIESDETQVSAYTRLARCHWEKGELETARLIYQQILQFDRSNIIASNRLAELNKQLDADQIVGESTVLERNPDSALHQSIDEELDPQILFNLGMAVKRRGMPEIALIALEKAWELCKQQYIGNALAATYRMLNKPERASKLYRQVLELNPNSYSVVGLAAVQRDLGEYDKAIANYESVLAMEPENSFALNGIAAVYSDLGRFDDVEDALLRAGRIQQPSALATLEKAQERCLQRGEKDGWDRLEKIRILMLEMGS